MSRIDKLVHLLTAALILPCMANLALYTVLPSSSMAADQRPPLPANLDIDNPPPPVTPDPR